MSGLVEICLVESIIPLISTLNLLSKFCPNLKIILGQSYEDYGAHALEEQMIQSIISTHNATSTRFPYSKPLTINAYAKDIHDIFPCCLEISFPNSSNFQEEFKQCRSIQFI
ncbi:hypothetical protein M422DRAFT_69823 [Sphaerobolus stellatus SS14]|uniref:Unplaced genomic scaffold SPHSTscaffold_107, whole genome shotgun sequence n=1 Tax=Sphaerobolus stellatus (strain SS14) TaxID=990650 RepID=A0A0C9VFB3_SPHS4|nr:hypothetical protein M422DRAFT_69823 [Sphaerobolus stellatus SS14]